MQKSKWTKSLAAIMLISALVLSACQGVGAPAADGEMSDGGAMSGGDMKIGLVTDVGRVNDRSFNQSAWEGVLQACESLGLSEGDDCKFIETQDPKDYADNIQQFVDNDYNVIVSVGFALGEATAVAAAENPDTFFIGVDQFQVEAVPNVAGLVFNEDRSGFLAGALASYLTQSGTVAAVLGTDLVPPVVAFGEGFVAGAKYINPDVTVSTTYHPGELSQAFIDPEWGAATAKQAIDQGADVIFGAGGLTGNGALQEVAANEGIYCIGVDTDQWETLPAAHPCLVSSAMKLITPGVADLIMAYSEGSMTSGNSFGGSALAPFHDFDSEISDDVKDSLATIKTALENGSLKTGYGE